MYFSISLNSQVLSPCGLMSGSAILLQSSGSFVVLLLELLSTRNQVRPWRPVESGLPSLPQGPLCLLKTFKKVVFEEWAHAGSVGLSWQFSLSRIFLFEFLNTGGLQVSHVLG